MSAPGSRGSGPADGKNGASQVRGARLKGGTAVLMRPIEPSDEPRLLAFHETLSERTSRRRFFGFHPHLSSDELRRFTTVDHRDREAFVMTVDDEILAVGRLDREPGTRSAEIAFVVGDRWQNRGAGTLLLTRLVECARSIGVDQLVADTLNENRPMIELLRRSGLVTKTSYDGEVLTLTLTLDAEYPGYPQVGEPQP